MFTVAENYAELTNASEKYFKRGISLQTFIQVKIGKMDIYLQKIVAIQMF